MKNKILKLIKESKADIKEFHLERMKKEYPHLKTVNDILHFISDWEITGNEDLIYIMGRIDALEELERG